MRIDHLRLFAHWARRDHVAFFRRPILMIVALLLMWLGQTVDAQARDATAVAATPVIDGWNTRQSPVC
jgi:hypothetical protein